MSNTTNNHAKRSNPWLQKPISALPSDEFLTAPPTTSAIQSPGTSIPKSFGSCENLPELSRTFSMNPGNSHTSTLTRHLTLFDLVSIGVGGTIGSGIFVLCGLIANSHAGPATWISWVIAGISALLSGCCYAELSGRIPAAGSCYAYVYASMGELPAVIVAGCLSLEYMVSAAAVARSWGDKMVDWMRADLGMGGFVEGWLTPGYNFNPMAFLVSLLSVGMLLGGVKESKKITNVVTVVKIGLVGVMIVGGLWFIDFDNFTPFVPPEFGVTGIMRGSMSSFFGFLGFDEICCMAGEAINPRQNLPRSIMLTLAVDTFLYVCAAIALTGMQYYTDISGVSGFPEAFRSNGANVLAQFTAAGEVMTLPVVVLIALMAQPRLQYALAQDGLMPIWFAQLDSTGNLWNGTVSSGILMILIASFIPFTHLNDMISAGVLVAFCMANSSLLLLRRESPQGKAFYLERLIGCFNLVAFFLSLFWSHFWDYPPGRALTGTTAIFLMGIMHNMWKYCPPVSFFGSRQGSFSPPPGGDDDCYFQTPFMPFFPCLGILVNWFLIAQLELMGIFLLLLFLAGCALFYFMYGAKNSVGNNGGWKNSNDMQKIGEYGVVSEEIELDEDQSLIRTISMPNYKQNGGKSTL